MAKLAESAGLGGDEETSSEARMAKIMNELRASREEVQQLSARVSRMSVAAAQPRSPTPERRQPRVSFQEPTPSTPQNGGPPTFNRNGRMFRGQSRLYNSSMDRQFPHPTAGMQSVPCDRCGRFHAYNRCPAMYVSCFICGRVGHLRAKCRSARRGVMNVSG